VLTVAVSVRIDHAETGHAETGRVKTGRVKTGHVKIGHVKIGHVKIGHVKIGSHTASKVEACPAQVNSQARRLVHPSRAVNSHAGRGIPHTVSATSSRPASLTHGTRKTLDPISALPTTCQPSCSVP
jgi:hypothetical protein